MASMGPDRMEQCRSTSPNLDEMAMASVVLGPSTMIVLVFLATTSTLLVSIGRDLKSHPDLTVWSGHLDAYITNS